MCKLTDFTVLLLRNREDLICRFSLLADLAYLQILYVVQKYKVQTSCCWIIYIKAFSAYQGKTKTLSLKTYCQDTEVRAVFQEWWWCFAIPKSGFMVGPWSHVLVCGWGGAALSILISHHKWLFSVGKILHFCFSSHCLPFPFICVVKKKPPSQNFVIVQRKTESWESETYIYI